MQITLCEALLASGAIAQAETHRDIRATYRSAVVGNLGLGLVLVLTFVGIQVTHGLLQDADHLMVGRADRRFA